MPLVLSNDVGINRECFDGSCIGNDGVEDRNSTNLTELVHVAGNGDTGIFGTAGPWPPWPPLRGWMMFLFSLSVS